MIARLSGRIVVIGSDHLVVDVGGVGYRVFVPAPLLVDAGPEGEAVTLFTHHHVRDNEMALYGAMDEVTIGLFEDLMSVGGVGPRLAMAVLSTMDALTVQRAIVAEDLDLLTEVPGVGRKTAQRMVLDLKSRLEESGIVPGDAQVRPFVAGSSPDDAEAQGALVALGYTRGEARRALASLDMPDEAGVEDRVLAALRALSG